MLRIEDFLNYLLLERNSSLLTLKSYSGDLKEFQLFFKTIEKSLTWEVIDSDLVRDWIESMMDKGMKATSVNRKLSALRTFYRYALKRKLVQNDPTYGIQGPKREKPLPQFLKESEVNELLDSKEWTDDYNSVLARTIILTFYTTGVRLAELVGLDDSDVDFDLRELKVTGKRNKQRIIPFGDELYMALKAYMRKRDEEIDKKSAAIFLSEKGKRVARSQIYAMVRQSLSSVSTLQKRSPHVLRHTFATAMLNHDAGLESVKKLLGHERLTTTEIYTHTTFEQLKEVYKHAHPRA
ncbi:recombinase [Prevotella brunnea]|uniref:Recombinase n=1 Tax=Prevotella brunnea TaxID=2508867 RepID=A0A5C8GKL7_9BACT|nr:tyrosine-type recombinase/integrase [Prevotella brunnea]MDR0186963.1 recombinase [Prevotella brunnea]TXJ62615.1 recombinase [Prevotella brunnea]